MNEFLFFFVGKNVKIVEVKCSVEIRFKEEEDIFVDICVDKQTESQFFSFVEFSQINTNLQTFL